MQIWKCENGVGPKNNMLFLGPTPFSHDLKFHFYFFSTTSFWFLYILLAGTTPLTDERG